MPGKGLARLLGSLAALAFTTSTGRPASHCMQPVLPAAGVLALESRFQRLLLTLPASLQHEVRHVGVEDAVDFCYLFPSESAMM